MSITQAQNVDEYIEEQKARLAKHPTCANTRYNLGMGYLTKRMFTEAEKEFLAAVEESPKMAEAYVQLGGICMYRDDMEGCLRYNLEAAKAQPFFAVPFANVGFVHMQRGEADLATKAFKKALTCDPKFVQAHANLGGLHFMQGDFEEAIKHCTKAIELEPMFGPAYHNLAMVYIEMKEYDKAVEAVEKAKTTHYEVPQKILDDLEALRNESGQPE